MPEDITAFRKPRYTQRDRQSLYMRVLLGVQGYLTRLLLLTGVNSRLVTFSWFVTAIVAYGIFTIGTPGSVVVGALLLYLKTMLDISDGEVGRFQKQQMDQRTDLRSHMQGIYLDRIQHVIESPLYGLSLGWGVYQMIGWRPALYCGCCMAACSIIQRADRLLRKTILADFQQQVCSLPSNASDVESAERTRLVGVFSKIIQTLKLWIVNNKRFNFLVLLCGLGDLALSSIDGRILLMPTLLAIAATIWLIYTLFGLISIQFSDQLLNDSLSALRK